MIKEQYDYLEEERQKIWQAVNELQNSSEAVNQNIVLLKDAVEKKTSDHEAEAKKSATQAATCRTRTKSILQESQEIQKQINGLFDSIKSFNESIPQITELYNSVKTKDSEIDGIQKKIQESATIITEKQGEIINELEEADTKLENAQIANDDISKAKEAVEELHKKITTAHDQAVKKNTAIKDVHDRIFGYVYEDEETGEDITVEGMKDELDNAYDTLNVRQAKLTEELETLKEETAAKHDVFLATEATKAEELKAKIRNLLPEAMTAGLSHAYEKKRDDEEESLKKAKTSFYISIGLLSITAFIPISIGAVFLYQNQTINEVILKIPRIFFIILPVYIPLFWLAISANRSVKLSKRLIEEYSHKESLSKTFEGLSTQVDNLNDDKNSNELRTRLLYNIISASSENPGKLIKDFHSTDNPIFNILDKSLAFSESLEKLSFIPGIKIISQKIINKQRQAEASAKKALGESLQIENELEDYDKDEENEQEE